MNTDDMLVKFADNWMNQFEKKPNKGERKVVLQFARLVGRMMTEQIYVKKEN